MPLRITGLDRLQTLLERAVPATRAVWQEEARVVVRFAQESSPVDTALLFKSWRFRTDRTGGAAILNGATRDGRRYDRYAHRAGEPTPVIEEVYAFATARLPALRERLARVAADTVNRG